MNAAIGSISTALSSPERRIDSPNLQQSLCHEISLCSSFQFSAFLKACVASLQNRRNFFLRFQASGGEREDSEERESRATGPIARDWAGLVLRARLRGRLQNVRK